MSARRRVHGKELKSAPPATCITARVTASHSGSHSPSQWWSHRHTRRRWSAAHARCQHANATRMVTVRGYAQAATSARKQGTNSISCTHRAAPPPTIKRGRRRRVSGKTS